MAVLMVVRILRQKKKKILHTQRANSGYHFHEFCTFLRADFSTLKLSAALLYNPVCHTSLLTWFYLVCSFVLCAFLCFFFYFLALFYFINFTPKWFVLAVAAVSAKLRAVLLYKILKSTKVYNFCATLLILHTTSNSVQNSAHAEF